MTAGHRRIPPSAARVIEDTLDTLHYGSSGTYLPVKGLISHGNGHFRQGLPGLPGHRAPRGRRARPAHRGRRVPRPRRPLRLWQVHLAPHARGPRGRQRGPHPHRRPRRHGRPAEGPRHRDGVPELRAVPAHDGRRQHGLRAQDRRHPEGGDPPARRGGRQDPRPLPVPRPQAEGPLRWPASARRHGPRHRAFAPGVPHGRAAVEPRRQAPRPDPYADRVAAASSRCHHRLRHARPDRGPDHG